MKNIEVLAPVGSFKNLKLAINSGANAVYFGIKGFNARQKAENVGLEDLPNFVKLAHLHGVKTYMTLNILIKNDEFDEVLQIVDKAIESNVDAFIVQDIGLATYLLKNYKNISLHASTQMGIHNLDGAKFLEGLGFERVVLSRETRLEDIVEIKQNTNLEIEYFVQGALCVAFSGNCYYSSLMFNESGNRGKCLQTCRMCYEAYSNNKKIKDGYLLSPKDLCLIKQLDTLIDAGVSSLKIEGRLRRESYLVQAVSSYVKALTGEIDSRTEIDKLKKVFSRGDYNYGNYLVGNDKIIDIDNANHKGEKIGVVKNFYPFKNLFKVEIETNKTLNSGDGIKIINGRKELSLGIGNVDYLNNGNAVIYTKHKPIKGDVYLALDSEYEKFIIPKDKKIGLDIDIVGEVGKPMIVSISNGKIFIKLESDFVCEKAVNQPIGIDAIDTIFRRVKDTEFEVNNIKINIENIFIAKSLINKFKNDCIIEMEKQILENVNINRKNVIKIGGGDNKYGFSANIGNNTDYFIYSSKVVKNDKNNIIFAPEIFSEKVIENFISNNSLDFVYINLPIVATGKEVKYIDRILEKFSPEKVGVVANNYWALKYLAKGFRTIAGYNLNITNKYSAEFYKKICVENFAKSIENDLVYDMREGLSFEGYPVLMTWCHCPYKVSKSSTCDDCKFDDDLIYKLNDGKEFKIRRYKILNCYFELVSTKKIESKSKNKICDLR